MWRNEQNCICCGQGRHCWSLCNISYLEPTGHLRRELEFIRNHISIYFISFFSQKGRYYILPGASIENDFEGLRWSSNGDGTVVISVLVVGERLRLDSSLLRMSSGSLVLDQGDSHHCRMTARVANSQEKHLNVKLVRVSPC